MYIYIYILCRSICILRVATYIYIYTCGHRYRDHEHRASTDRMLSCSGQLSLYKILFHLKALLGSPSSSTPPPLTCKADPTAILLHDYCAIYNSPQTIRLYAAHPTILVMAISCKGQG